jgi:ubiquinone/menaquinone biosynthesis C-methylase UbiE
LILSENFRWISIDWNRLLGTINIHKENLFLSVNFFTFAEIVLQMLKSKIKKVIFQLGLAPLFERLNFLKERLKNRKINVHFRKENPNVVLPPDFYMYETFTLNYQKYFEGGKNTAQWLADHFKAFITLENISVLDWGCGPGRTIRHLPEIMGDTNQYYGSDYNQNYVQWCSDHIQDVTFKKNNVVPPLDFEKDALDVIYGISIFTHLSEKNHHLWMDEFHRVLKKNGIVFLTTHGEITKQKLSPEDQKKFDSSALVVQGFKKEGNRLFAAYQPYAFFKSLCEKHGFNILKHIPGEVVNNKPLQDVWILQK